MNWPLSSQVPIFFFLIGFDYPAWFNYGFHHIQARWPLLTMNDWYSVNSFLSIWTFALDLFQLLSNCPQITASLPDYHFSRNPVSRQVTLSNLSAGALVSGGVPIFQRKCVPPWASHSISILRQLMSDFNEWFCVIFIFCVIFVILCNFCVFVVFRANLICEWLN